jgi:hypothetical protein
MNKYSTEFKDFTPDDLVGKRVMYEYGSTFSTKNRFAITTITKVTKTGFRTKRNPKLLFSFDGHQKGLNGRMGMATISRCVLLTEDEAKQIINQWERNIATIKLKEAIISLMDNDHIGYQRLSAIKGMLEEDIKRKEQP